MLVSRGSGRHRSRIIFVFAVLAALVVSPAIHAQEKGDVAAAANAFSRGQKAALTGDNAQAAELFELADSIAPTPEALRSALNARRALGQLATAAAHAEELLRRYPDDAESKKLAQETIDAAKQKLGRHEVSCTPDACQILIDKAAVGADPKKEHVVYLSPGSHELVAVFGTRRAAPQTVDSTAGGSSSLSFTAPEATASTGAGATTDLPPDADRGPVTQKSGGLSPWIFGVAAATTAVLGGITIWSGMDTLSKHDEYEKNQTEAGYQDGLDRERRTNILLGATAVAGVATITLAFFTNWSGNKSAKKRPLQVGVVPAGPSSRLILRGSFQ